MKVQIVIGVVGAFSGLVLFGTSAGAQTAPFPKAQIDKGAETFATYCSPCHGTRMEYPGGSFDLRIFPPDQHSRFVNSVTKGKNNMPPWGDLFQADDIEALWAYVMAGEKK
jgi:mono/diheme cytochrome c family protein